MPYKSRWSIDIPKCSLPTFLFKSPNYHLGDQVCFFDATRPETHFITREQFRLWSLKFATGLKRSKYFSKGDRVLLFSGNDFFVPIVFMGILCAGGIFTAANPTFVARELAHQLIDSKATYLLCSDAAIDTGIEAAKLANLSSDRIFVFNSGIYDDVAGGHDDNLARSTKSTKSYKYWGELVASDEESKGFQWDNLFNSGEENTTLALNYSSGTTGIPKGVEITHYNYISNTLQVAYIYQRHPNYERMTAKSKWLCFLPLYHAYGQTYYIAGAFNRQIPVYVMSKFDFIQVLENIQKYKITDFTLVPPIAVALAKHPDVPKYDLSSIEFISCGAAPLGQDVSLQVEKRLGNRVNLRQGWGMTECTCSLLGWDINEWADSNAVGEPNANCECKIMSEENDKEILERGPQARGELWCRAPNVMKGYWKNPKATSETITSDGWLKTGDIAYVDENGKFFIVDRKKELIKVKGNQVAPAELEALLLKHPAIADVAVIGIPTQDGDEKPRAFVVRQADQNSLGISQEEVMRFVEDKVVRYKRLAGGVEWIDMIPKNPSGKILRRQLRDQWKLRNQQARL